MSPVTPSRRVTPPPCESIVAGPSRSRASTGVQRSPAERRPVQRIKFFKFARKSSRAFENFFFFFFHPAARCKVRPQGAGCAASPTSPLAHPKASFIVARAYVRGQPVESQESSLKMRSLYDGSSEWRQNCADMKHLPAETGTVHSRHLQ